jgi:hypothetical protein
MMTPTNFSIIDPEGQKPKVTSMKGFFNYLKNTRQAIQEFFSAASNEEDGDKTTRIRNESDSDDN